MTKRITGTVAKLSVIHCEPPTLQTTTRTSAFAVETFNQSPHLPAPIPSFGERSGRTGYSGVPIYLVASVTNTRFQPLRDVLLTVTVVHGTRTIYPGPGEQPQNRPRQTIDPQKWITFPLQVTCLVPGNVKVIVRSQFVFENQKMDTSMSYEFKILPSVQIVRSKPSKIVQVQIENKIPNSLLLNVKARTPNQETNELARFLNYESAASTCFVMDKNPIDKIEISWSLPFAQKCLQNIGLDKLTEKKPLNFEIHFSSIPQTIPALKPFKVTIVLRNTTAQPITGDILFQKGDKILHLVGKNLTHFQNLMGGSEVEMPFNFIALSQGSHILPDMNVKIEGVKQPYTIKSNTGILVIGHNDE